MTRGEAGRSVAVVGGGLAGLAAAAALADRGLRVELFEMRRRLGGRAGSFQDPAGGDWIDHCQHVAMGCCTNLADFCRRTGIADCFQRHARLHFLGPDGRRADFAAWPWLPAPLHLLPGLMRLTYLSPSERMGIAKTLGKMAALSQGPGRQAARGAQATGGSPGKVSCTASGDGDAPACFGTDSGNPTRETTVGGWLRDQGQSERAVERFWAPVILSALSESPQRASLSAARKVFVDGFLAARQACEIEIPCLPLSEIYDRRLGAWLHARGVKIHLETRVKRVEGEAPWAAALAFADGSQRGFDFFVVAVPWRQAPKLFAPPLTRAIPALAAAARIEPAAISALHLWFDRPITRLPHAVLIGRLSQWVFRHGSRSIRGEGPAGGCHYQVVISASHVLTDRNRRRTAETVLEDLGAVFPAARKARLLRHRLVTNPEAVFSPRPGLDALRPPQPTPVANLALAGDWTATGWPATMEGAVRSGYLAAEAILRAAGRPEPVLVPDLPRALLARWMAGA